MNLEDNHRNRIYVTICTVAPYTRVNPAHEQHKYQLSKGNIRATHCTASNFDTFYLRAFAADHGEYTQAVGGANF